MQRTGEDMLCAFCDKVITDDEEVITCGCCEAAIYCRRKCQKSHWSTHQRDCELRSVVLQDDLLFQQPAKTHLGDCPLCCLPIPVLECYDGGSFLLNERNFYKLYPCCMKIVCHGCISARSLVERSVGISPNCPFCSRSFTSMEKGLELIKTEAEEGNALAICEYGDYVQRVGSYNGVTRNLGDDGRHFESYDDWMRAAAMGSIQAHFALSAAFHHDMYGYDDADVGVSRNHAARAAIAGHPVARFNLGVMEKSEGNRDRAVMHWNIAARQGSSSSMKKLKELKNRGSVSKEYYLATKEAYREAKEKMASHEKSLALSAHIIH